MSWEQRRRLHARQLRNIVAALDEPVLLTGVLGNMGDRLIWAGAEKVLGRLLPNKVTPAELEAASGPALVVPGNGGFGPAHHGQIPPLVLKAAQRFETVLILPSTYDVSLQETRDVLRTPNVVPLAREQVSADAAGCQAMLDCGVHAVEIHTPGEGELICMRTDGESAGGLVPDGNDDISLTAGSLDEWLTAIERVSTVTTDRAHVMLAAGLMGKTVRYSEGNYFKNRALAEFTFGDDFPNVNAA